ncbi:hypothetical protein XOCgx_1183 [Xanthomonas oryzae pv. oryzicola]|nr:hypothetical protein XOCgx_1183 [Xanthomonas oryzae pv. oryzicola]
MMRSKQVSTYQLPATTNPLVSGKAASGCVNASSTCNLSQPLQNSELTNPVRSARPVLHIRMHHASISVAVRSQHRRTTAR